MVTDFLFKLKQFFKQAFCHHEYVYEVLPIFNSKWVCKKCGRHVKRRPAIELMANTENNKWGAEKK